MKQCIFSVVLMITMLFVVSGIAVPAFSQSSSSDVSNPEMVQSRAQDALCDLHSAETAYLAISHAGRYATFNELQSFPEPVPGTALISPTHSPSDFIYRFSFVLMKANNSEKYPSFIAVAYPMEDSSSSTYPIMIDQYGLLFKLVPQNPSFTPSEWREIIDSEQEVFNEKRQYQRMDSVCPADTLFLSEDADEYILRREVLHMMSPTVLQNSIDCTVWLKLKHKPHYEELNRIYACELLQ